MTDEEIRRAARKAFDDYASPPLRLFSPVMRERVEAIYRAGMAEGWSEALGRTNVAPAVPGKQGVYCAKWLHANGLASPPKCAKCGKGPCKEPA